MNLLTLYKKEATKSGTPVLVMALVSGIFQGLILGIITNAASEGSEDLAYFKYLGLFAVSFAIAILGKHYALTESTRLAEIMIKNIRMRISDKIRNSELLFLENIGKSEVYTLITQNTNLISESVVLIINACQAGIVLVCCLFYIAYLSQLSFLITLAAIFAGIFTFMMHQNSIDSELRQTTIKETQFFDMLYNILDGFKELKINRNKSDEYFSNVKKVADETEALKIQTGFRFVIEIMFSQVFFYILIAVIVFLLPKFNYMEGDLVIKVTTAVLFIIGPANQLVTAIPLVSRANIAVENIYSLENRLDKASKPYQAKGVVPVSKFDSFKKIEFKDIKFSYLDNNNNPLFSLGPLNMDVSSGEIIFIVGGNGSGKSSFMKLVTGLYYPVSGQILLDGTPIDGVTYPAYRELFSVIFSDFHLFDKLYGFVNIDENRVSYLLKTMQLEKKTELIDKGFTNINLSTGQRKRLAMIVAMLENRSICVFDEWAADQDPIFREFFYKTLLQEMKKEGKTVIAVSHDDRYFHMADRIIKMEYGQFV
ncbi:Cyclic peptide transporter [Desulfamplus magnetovallimortis]|uniref:Cyclic peptide transporter n=1 Tax=Desulfamplus magnetovallimortis TaxID=1246637 RepID=A0A1W1HKZ1_9BACT|nr:cyclic peptide export ABC transporter [Desulfamplus magnetovallimortis]SLM33123.1 Cyclic peptide transporter [Desulfamplus magnetovallimortis]